MRRIEDEEEGSDKLGCNVPRTFGSLRQGYQKFCTLNKHAFKAKECFRTVNPPLFDELDEMLVSEKCIFPELHNLSGGVNHTFYEVPSRIGECFDSANQAWIDICWILWKNI